jgi:hypothetical protein
MTIRTQRLVLSTAALCSVFGLANSLRADMALYLSNGRDGTVRKIQMNGTVSTYASGLLTPRGLAFDSANNLYVACAGDGDIYKITPAGEKTVFATGLANPYGLAIDPSSNLYVADMDASAVYRVDQTGALSVFAVADSVGGVVYSSGNLYVTNAAFDSGGNTRPGGIYKIDGAGLVSNFATGLSDPIGLTTDGNGNLYAAEFGWSVDLNPPMDIQKIDAAGLASQYAPGGALGHPYGLAFGPGGTLYAADFAGGAVNSIAPDGTVSSFVTGLGTPRFMISGSDIAAPEPASLSLVGVGCLLLLRRTRTRK